MRSLLQAALGAQYALERELGRGGMATVYLARDLRHRRGVAVKVLHPELSALLGPERFLKEIEVTASLQHPHILPLFDSGSAEGLLYYVMPYVEGETLRARLEREKQLPVDDAVTLARDVASALAYAHVRGVIHRDVKPENVLLAGGPGEPAHALVADFGIALAVQQAGGARMTQTGLSLGTPQYMAPEQAMGEKTVDARADQHALAAVLYEMLAGEPPFSGPTSQAVVARVMTESPRSLRPQRPSVPAHIDAAVLRALEKLPADRFPNVSAFSATLGAPTSAVPTSVDVDASLPSHTTESGASGARAAGWPSFRLTPGGAAILAAGALAAGAALGWGLRQPASTHPLELEPVRFAVELDSATTLGQTTPAISPDTRTIVYTGVGPKGTVLYARRVDSLANRPLAGTDDGEWPFFSPDGEWIAFYSNGAIRKARLDGGSTQEITNLPGRAVFCGGTWGPDDVILYTTGDGALYRVSAGGGVTSRITPADSTLRVRTAQSLPDGRSVLVNVAETRSRRRRGSNSGRIGVMDLGSGRIREFGPALGARYVPGYLVYADEDGRLFRRPFDLDRIEPSGSAERIASNVAYAEGRLGRVGLGLSGLFPSFDVSSTGTLVYRTAAIPTSTSQHLTVFDRAGRQLQVIPGRVPWTPRFSPDGRRVAYGAFAPGSSLNDARDLWITDVAAGTTQRVTTDANDNNDPHWSPDGQSVAYSALDTGSRKELRVQPLTGGRARRATVRPNTLPLGTEWPSDWSSDGRVLLFTQVATGEDDMDLWVQPVAGDTARPYLTTTAREFGARLSPDGRWAAYTSNETGRNEVYVQAFPTPGPKTPVSVGGGHGPVWRGDGKELYFWHDGQLFAVAVDGAGTGSALTLGKPTRLFSAPYVENFHPNYDVSPDGTRFVVVTGPPLANRLIVELNVLAAGAQTTRKTP